MAALIVILALSFLVIIHELGHYLVARWVKIRVEEFGVGYPPRMINLSKKNSFFRWGETVVSINWIPFGGFVKMAGENARLDNAQASPGDFMYAGPLQRLAVVIAGPLVNLVFGLLVFSIMFGITGIPQDLTGARIESVAPGSPAEQVGLPTNVEIIAFQIDDEVYPISSIFEVQDFVSEHRGQLVKIITTGECEGLACQESSQSFDVSLRSIEDTPEGQGSLGVVFSTYVTVHYPWYRMPIESAKVGMRQTFVLSMMILDALRTLVTDLGKGQFSDQVAGPIGIVHQAEETGYFDQGWVAIAGFTAMLSINLAVINLLPIPPLDGGRVMTTLLEPLLGKKRSSVLEYYLNYGGYILLMLLIVAVTARDVFRIFF